VATLPMGVEANIQYPMAPATMLHGNLDPTLDVSMMHIFPKLTALSMTASNASAILPTTSASGTMMPITNMGPEQPTSEATGLSEPAPPVLLMTFTPPQP
jgi:hypothetical protein